MAELKKCPFCGGEAEYDKKTKFDHHGDMYTNHLVWCPYPVGGCGVRVYAKSKSEAIKRWNTRKPIDDIVQRLEKHKSYNQMMLKKFPKMGTIENAIYKTQRDTYESAIEIAHNSGKGE